MWMYPEMFDRQCQVAVNFRIFLPSCCPMILNAFFVPWNCRKGDGGNPLNESFPLHIQNLHVIRIVQQCLTTDSILTAKCNGWIGDVLYWLTKRHLRCQRRLFQHRDVCVKNHHYGEQWHGYQSLYPKYAFVFWTMGHDQEFVAMRLSRTKTG